MMDYTSDEIESVLNSLGLVLDRVEETGRGEEFYSHCPGHVENVGRVDRSASWSINAGSGRHNCWSCGFSGSLEGLVAYIRDLKNRWGDPDIDAAKAWLRDNVELTVDGLAEHLDALREIYNAPEPVAMSPARLAVFNEPPSSALEARGVSEEQAERYGVRWAAQSEVWITPVYDPETDNLLGWQEKGQGHRFFMNRPINLKKSRTIFGWPQYAGGPAVVVESPLDAVRISSVLPGVTGLSTMGAVISQAQIKLLSGVYDLTFALDNDAPGLKASSKMLDAARQGWFECWFWRYGKTSAKDPGDQTDDEIRWSWENRRHEMLGKQAFTHSAQ